MVHHSSESVKIDISVAPPILEAADHLAKKLGLSLTELHTLALTSYMTKYQENITETLDCIYEHEPSAIEPAVANAQTISLGEEEAW